MMMFNQLVFDRTVRGTTEMFSPATFNELLGRADSIVYEIEVSEATGTSPAITVRHHHCNSNEDGAFKAKTAFISAASLASLPYRDVVSEGSVKLAGYGKVGVQLSNADNIARVRIWATGRGE